VELGILESRWKNSSSFWSLPILSVPSSIALSIIRASFAALSFPLSMTSVFTLSGISFSPGTPFRRGRRPALARYTRGSS
jgi:hypothetical protein